MTADIKQQRNQMVVSIADNVLGVSPEVLAKIFEKGGRKYRPGAVKGTGMGLYLCRLLV